VLPRKLLQQSKGQQQQQQQQQLARATSLALLQAQQ
jgi:hypothetical protein